MYVLSCVNDALPNSQGSADYSTRPVAMAQLPVFEARAALLHQVSRAPTLVLVGATGSGKSTQIPQYLFHAGYPTIGVTQPRRVAATSVARRVATEMGVALGEEVGYCVRFDNCSSRDTRIRYLTDGMLLREALSDTSLRRYAVVIVDEAHERSLQTDILLGVLKAAQQLRALATQPLRLVVMSATLDVGLFCEFFGGAAACRLVGRAHPVQLLYTPEPEVDYLEAAVAAIVQIHLDEADGDVLVFLAGQEDIEAVETALRKRQRLFPPSARPLLVCPLFAALPASKQELALRRAQGGARKAILATNIAETSLTIGGIVFVVDAGLAKQRGTHASDGGQLLASLLAQPISRASARQRAGRAGRERPGKCFRLYSEATFAGLAPTAVPEVARSSLAASVLLLYALGVRDVFSFDFITPPPAIALEAAHVQLLQLGALDGQCEITAQGRRMASLPLEPQHAKALLASRALGCYAPVLTLLALLTIEVSRRLSSRVFGGWRRVGGCVWMRETDVVSPLSTRRFGEGCALPIRDWRVPRSRSRLAPRLRVVAGRYFDDGQRVHRVCRHCPSKPTRHPRLV